MSPQLPFDFDDVKQIDFPASKFCFTGNFNYGTKKRGAQKRSEKATEAQGGIVHPTVRMDTDYLVVGAEGSGRWIYGDYGRKIERANELKADGYPIKIISENTWARSLTALNSNVP
jgi:NAD-dependent DNA ligase